MTMAPKRQKAMANIYKYDKERVFTEEEVKAMLDEVFIALCYDFPPQEARIIALKHGLSWPDPA